MTKAGKRILSAGTFALCALVAAVGAVGAGSASAPLARYVEPDRGNFVRVAGLFGESDEEKDARLQHEQNQDDAINRLNDKVRDLEDTVRSLTGENEELTHRVGELNDKIDRQQKDFEYRLCTMASQQLGSSIGQGDPNAVPCGGSAGGGSGGAAPTASDNSDTQGGRGGETAQHLAPGPGVLGTLPADSANSLPPAANPNSTDDTRTQFSTAMNLLAKARYDEARAAFRSFADTYPKDELAPQAVYWVGDIAYVQKDYGNAARAFAEVIKKYPNSLRAPDSMLKLGQALIASGQKKEGCTALAALPAKYPKASKAILAQGTDARKAVCRGIS